MSMRKPNGRRIGLLLILIALLVYAGCLLWAEKLEQLSSFDLLAIIISICRIGGGIGLLLVFISLIFPASPPELRPTGALHTLGAGRQKRLAQPFKASRRISGLPAFGLMGSLFFSCILVTSSLWNPYLLSQREIGFKVTSIKDISSIQPFPGYAPLIVHIDFVSHDEVEGSPHYFLNSEEVELATLPGRLEEALRYRPDKVVFIEAGHDTDYQSVISAIDAVKGSGAAAVLVTSAPERMRR